MCESYENYLTFILFYYFQEEERKMAVQLKSPVMPIKQTQAKLKARVISEEEKKFGAYATLRRVSNKFHHLL